MKDTFYITLMLAMDAVVLLTFLYSLRKRSMLGVTLSGVLLSAFAIISSYVPALFVSSEMASSICYSIYFIANSWICLMLFLYAQKYAQRPSLPKGAIVFSVIWFIVDNFSLLLNPWTHHEVLYAYEEIGGISCWAFHGTAWFYVHLLLCYILLGIFFVNLFAKFIRAPRLYKLQYGVTLLVMIVCVMGNAVFLAMSSILDVSVILYGLAAVLLYYFTFTFIPRKLTLDMGALVVYNLNSAVAFFDLNEECIYADALAEEWFCLKRGKSHLDDFKTQLSPESKEQGERHIEHVLVDDIDRYYRVEYQELHDERDRYLGCFFLVEDVTAEHIAQEERIYQASHDLLTGLNNRNTFCAEAEELLDAHPDVPYSVITSNILQFKLLNDLLGREAGDELLKTIAEAFASSMREGMVCGRLESDKFAACAPTNLQLENELERKLRDLGSNYNLSVAVTNYYGVYHVEEYLLPVSVMCDRANMALNEIKQDANQRIAYYDTDLRNTMLRENQLSAEIPRALEAHQFEVYFQPQYDSRTAQVVGAEALVRWNHPTKGLLSPGMFIPLLERMNLIYQLDQYVWEETCAKLVDLRKRGYAFPISVNISPRDVYSFDIYHVITALVEKYGIPAESLNLEITESAMVLNMDMLNTIIQRLQNRGFLVEMDDFGSGYSSLNTLKDIPVDILKLDMRFLESGDNPDRSAKIIKVVAGLSQVLGVPMIAEGVETEEQVEFLSGIGCCRIQGFYYSRPIPFDELLVLLAEQAGGVA